MPRYDISATAKTIVECDASGANQKSVASTVITEVSDQSGFHEKTGSVQVRGLPRRTCRVSRCTRRFWFRVVLFSPPLRLETTNSVSHFAQIDPLGLAGFAFEVTNQLPVANLARFGVDAAGRLPFVGLDLVYGCHGYFDQTSGDAQCAETGFLGVSAATPVADFSDADDSVVCRISDPAVAAVAPIAGAGGCGIQFFGNETRGGDVQIAVKALNFPFRAVRAPHAKHCLTPLWPWLRASNASNTDCCDL